jgi:bacterioferritin
MEPVQAETFKENRRTVTGRFVSLWTARRTRTKNEEKMDKKVLIQHLNGDLANELSAIIQYLTYAVRASGPYRPQLAQFFQAEVTDEQLHVQYLANKIVALGGEPVTEPAPVAEAFGDKGLAVQLEDMVRDESNHSEETQRLLQDWPL